MTVDSFFEALRPVTTAFQIIADLVLCWVITRAAYPKYARPVELFVLFVLSLCRDQEITVSYKDFDPLKIAESLKVPEATGTPRPVEDNTPEEDKSCSNCRFETTFHYEHPCDKCMNETHYTPYWRPKERPEEERLEATA